MMKRKILNNKNLQKLKPEKCASVRSRITQRLLLAPNIKLKKLQNTIDTQTSELTSLIWACWIIMFLFDYERNRNDMFY